MMTKRSPIAHQITEFFGQFAATTARVELDDMEYFGGRRSSRYFVDIDTVSSRELEQEGIPRVYAARAIAVNPVGDHQRHVVAIVPQWFCQRHVNPRSEISTLLLSATRDTTLRSSLQASQ